MGQTPEQAMEASVSQEIRSGAMESPNLQLEAIERFMQKYKLTERQAVTTWSRIVCKVGSNISTH